MTVQQNTLISTHKLFKTVKSWNIEFSLLSTKPAESFSVLSSQRRQDVFLHFFWQSNFFWVQLSQPYVATGHISAFISRIFVEMGMLWLFHIFCSDALITCPLFNLVRNSVVHSPSSVIRDPRYGNVSTCSSSSFWMNYGHVSIKHKNEFLV